MNNKFVLSLIICVIAAGGLGFYGGTFYQKGQTPAAPARAGFAAGGQGRGQGAGRLGGAGGAGGFSNGEIVSKDASSITLKLMDGGSKIVLFSTSTRVGKMSEGSMTDLATGTNVMVTGTPNQDGSLTASNIQIRPAGTEAFMQRGGGRPPIQDGQPAPLQP
jgi:hypothetical protein